MRVAYAGLLLALLAFVPASAQDLVRRGPKAASTPQGPLLTFHLAVYDSKGQAFRTLRDVDLDIRDDGKQIPAAYLRPLQTSGSRPTSGDPNELTNRPLSGSGHVAVVLLDLLNTNFAERSFAWRDAVSALRKVESPERLYVYLLTEKGTLFAVRALPDAFHPASANESGWTEGAQQMVAQAMAAVNGHRSQELQHDPVAVARRTLSAVRTLAAGLAPQPARKSLVWVSHGFPTLATGEDGREHDYTGPIQRLGSELAQSGIEVYGVEQADRNPTIGLHGVNMLQQFANVTGGQWFSNGATEEALRQAMSAGPAMYEVGYRPLPERWDDKFHELKITAAAKGGARLRVQTISGYFGEKVEQDEQRRAQLAAIGQVDATGIGISAAAGPSNKGPGWVHLKTRVDAADLHFSEGPAADTEIRVALAFYVNGWQPNLSEPVAFPLHFTAAQHAAVVRDGLTLLLDRPIRGDATMVRIVVDEPATNTVGSLTVPLHAPDAR
jgi:VWFA-related protein